MANTREFDSRKSRVIFMGLLSLLVMACGVQWATGQVAAPGYYVATYDPIFMTTDKMTGEPKLDEKVVKGAAFIKNQVLLGSLPYQENADKLKKYYGGYFFRSLTRPENLHTLPIKRKEIVEDLRRAKTKDVQTQIRNDTFDTMKKFVPHARVHPAVRFNAMLIVGDLNADEQNSLTQQRFANPLPEALDFMLEQYESPTQLDSVRLAAMIGIMRHEQLNRARPDAAKIPPAKQQRITDLMLALINTKDPPRGRLPDGHTWMQRRAVEILAEMALVGTHDNVTRAVTGLVREHNADLTLRCSAAEALGKTVNAKAPAKSKISDPAKESLQLAALLVEACHSELSRMEVWHKKQMQLMDPTGAMGGDIGGAAGGGMMPGGGGMMPGGMMPGGGSGMMPGGGGMMPGGGGMMPGGMMPGGGSGMMPGGGGGMMPGGMPGGGSGMMPGYGGEGGDATGAGMMAGPKDPVVELFRRQLKYEIECVRRGIGGVSRIATTDPKKPAFQDLTKDIDSVLKATDPLPHQATLPGLYKSVKDSLKTLETKTALLLPKPKTPPAEEETDDPLAAPAAPVNPAAAGAARPAAPGVAPASGAVPGAGGVNTMPPGPAAAPGASRPGAAAPGAAAPRAAAPGAAAPGAAVPNSADSDAPAAPPAPAAAGAAGRAGAGAAAPPKGTGNGK